MAPPVESPDCPDWLDEVERGMWDELIPQLTALKVLAKIDKNALSRYCNIWARWRSAVEFLKKHGETYLHKDKEVAYPQVGSANKLEVQLLRLEQEFGLTPSARSRVAIEKPPDEPQDELERLLSS